MKILIVILGRIGDMILATPMFNELVRHYPDAEIYVLAGRQNNIIVQNNPVLKKVIIFNKNPFFILKTIFAATAATLVNTTFFQNFLPKFSTGKTETKTETFYFQYPV